MKVYILTEEPYHDNSTLMGVYLTEELGIAALHEIQNDPKNPTTPNGNDFSLIEWDTDTQKQCRQWCLWHEWVNTVGPLPWRKEEIGTYCVGVSYILEEPE